MSQEVLEGQQWLNSTYGSKAGYISVKETGLPGTAVSPGRLRRRLAGTACTNIRDTTRLISGDIENGNFYQFPIHPLCRRNGFFEVQHHRGAVGRKPIQGEQAKAACLDCFRRNLPIRLLCRSLDGALIAADAFRYRRL